MIVVGLTGGIASGKSTVSAILKKAGAVIIDADLVARQVVAPGLPAWQAIKSQFGDRVIGPGGAIRRDVLADMVFNDRPLRKQLESIIHPQVRTRIDGQVDRLRQSGSQSVVVQDIPLLFEAGMTDGLCEIIVVYVPSAVQIQRLMHRDRIGRAPALARIHAQMPMEEKRRRATMVIDNAGLRAATERQTLDIYAMLDRRAKGTCDHG